MKVKTTDVFTKWLNKLKDSLAQKVIVTRLRRIEITGNLGDVKNLGDGVFEMRIFYGPGYRLYFVNQEESIILLLCGGDKSSQEADIAKAKHLAKEV